MNKERESRPKGLISMLRYIFDRRDKGKLLLLLMAIVIGSFLELMGVMVFMPFVEIIADRKSTRLNSSHCIQSRITSSA